MSHFDLYRRTKEVLDAYSWLSVLVVVLLLGGLLAMLMLAR